MARRRPYIIGLITAATFPGVAMQTQAQTPSLAAIAGAWNVDTPPDRLGCVVHGSAIATPSGRNVSVELQVLETCPDGDVRAHERCVGPMVRAALTLRCVVTSGGEYYAADQFDLHVETPDLMQGRLLDLPLYNDPVRWTRPAGAPIS